MIKNKGIVNIVKRKEVNFFFKIIVYLFKVFINLFKIFIMLLLFVYLWIFFF